MKKAIPKDNKYTIKRIREKLQESFGDNLKALILYGSWVKGTANADSDIDLLVVLDHLDGDIRKKISDISYKIDSERIITITPCELHDFMKEAIPLYTAVKKEGEVITGTIDLSLSPEPPEVKYAEFLKKSEKVETDKVKTAETLLEKDLISGIPEFCFIASKHAIQATLAMKGKGYTSKVSRLIPLAEEYLGEEFSASFKKVFDIFIRAEYELIPVSRKEAGRAIKLAIKTLEVYKKWR